jgi:hypothetical protein
MNEIGACGLGLKLKSQQKMNLAGFRGCNGGADCHWGPSACTEHIREEDGSVFHAATKEEEEEEENKEAQRLQK